MQWFYLSGPPEIKLGRMWPTDENEFDTPAVEIMHLASLKHRNKRVSEMCVCVCV